VAEWSNAARLHLPPPWAHRSVWYLKINYKNIFSRGCEMSDTKANKQIVMDYFSALGARDMDALYRVISKDAEIWVPEGTRFSGTYTPITYLKNLDDNVVPLLNMGGIQKMDIISVTAEENRVSVEAESYMDLNNGKVYNNKYHLMFKIDGGLIVSLKEYLNTQHVVEVLD
jgi:ketosteroid isomerase-like protein